MTRPSGARQAERGLLGLFVVSLFWLPLPLGSNRPWAIALFTAMVWLLLALTGLLRLARPAQPSAPSRSTGWGSHLVLALLVAFTAWCGLQLTPWGYTEDPHETRMYVLRCIGYLGAFWLVQLLVTSDRRRMVVLGGMLGAGVVQALVAMVLFSAASRYELMGFEFRQGIRATGTFTGPDALASYLLIALSAGLAVMLAQMGLGRDAPAHNWQGRARSALEFMMSTKMLVRIMLILMVIALVLTRSRMGNGTFFLSLFLMGAAVFTPQAAAAIGWMAPPEQRGRAITSVFLGWSLASVLGMPLHSYIGEAFGWRWAFGLVALLAGLGALWVGRALPEGVKPPALSLSRWAEVLTHPVLMAIVLVTALAGAGQFTLFSYVAPYYRQVLGAGALEISLLFMAFGAWGLAGNLLLSRRIDRIGPARAVRLFLAGIAVGQLLWPLGQSVMLMLVVMVPWAFGTFATNSAQQARLGAAAPALAPALLALNTSAIYLGQAIGAASGGVIVDLQGFGALHGVSLGWTLLAIALSIWAERRLRRDPDHV